MLTKRGSHDGSPESEASEDIELNRAVNSQSSEREQ